MSLAKDYIAKIDTSLADMADARTGVAPYEALRAVLIWPMFILAIPTIGAGMALAFFGAPMVWSDACSIAFLVLAMLHVLVAAWRWYIFNAKA